MYLGASSVALKYFTFCITYKFLLKKYIVQVRFETYPKYPRLAC